MQKSLHKKIKKTLKNIAGITFLILTIVSAHALNFSEIMYNPLGSDIGREWIELSNPECDNLEEYKLFENNINHNMNIYSNGTCDYPIICDDCELFLIDYNVSSIVYESSFTLGNTGEYIDLRLNNTIIDSVDYTGMQNIEGMSITKYDYWTNTIPTPGYFVLEINETNITINITTNNTINETMNITLNQTINTTSNETAPENNSVERCNITLGLRLKEDKLIYYNKESIKFYNTLNAVPCSKEEFLIEYWVEDIYGNILKNKIQTNNLNEKSYTPSINEKTVAIIIKNQLINVSCNDSYFINILNGSSEKIIIIKNPDYKERECDKFEKCTTSDITKENSEVSLEITNNNLGIISYRGDDRKYVVNVYVKNDKNRKIADLLKLSLEKYSGISIELPLELGVCGEFEVFAEGLGFLESSKYYNECAQALANEEIISNKSTTYEKDLSVKNENSEQENTETNVSKFFHDPLIIGNVVYESKNEKTKDYSLIGIIILITGTLIYLLYRKIIRRKTEN